MDELDNIWRAWNDGVKDKLEDAKEQIKVLEEMEEQTSM